MAAERSHLYISNQSCVVWLRGDDLEPQFITPDSLKTEEIVDRHWELRKGSKLGITSCSFGYTNGVSVMCSREFLSFHQTNMLLPREEVLCVDVARKYLATFGGDDWTRAYLSLYGFIQVQMTSSLPKAHWFGLGSHWKYREVSPQIQLTATYQRHGKETRVDLYERTSEPGLVRFSCHISSGEQDWHGQNSSEEIRATLKQWETDWDESRELLTKLGKTIFQIGG